MAVAEHSLWRRTVMFRARAEYDGPSLGIFESRRKFFFFFDRED